MKPTQPRTGQLDMIGTPKDALTYRMPAKDPGETPLEAATREAQARAVQEEENKRQEKIA